MLFCLSYLSSVLAHDLNKVGHGEVHDVVLPRQLHDNVGVEEVVALKWNKDICDRRSRNYSLGILELRLILFKDVIS